VKTVRTIAETRDFLHRARAGGKTVGLVPTMGYFHEGHLSLMRRARRDNDVVVVSIFVNPTQFGPDDDLGSYPRDFERDAKTAEQVGVDLIFNPSVEEMYPEACSSYVEVERLTEGLCGASRTGHFRGVATVVLKLFNIIHADRAYFGRKDYQQLKVIERMVRDLNLTVEIVGMPTVREADGLAMSSRNAYLSPEERRAALVLHRALGFGQKLLKEGLASGSRLREEVERLIRREPLASIDYVAVVDTETLEPLDEIEDQAVLALAVRIGPARLIDTALLERPG